MAPATKRGSRVTALRSMHRREVEPKPAPRMLITAIAIFSFMAQTGFTFAQSAGTGQAATVRVDATPDHAINSFDPDSALGSSIDVLSRTEINSVYTPHIIQEALSARCVSSGQAHSPRPNKWNIGVAQTRSISTEDREANGEYFPQAW